MFRFHFNQFSNITKSFAISVFIVGMLFIGFSMLIFAIPAFFGILAALAFFIIGIVIVSYGVRMLIALGRMDRFKSDGNDEYRENVRIHYEDHYFED